MNTIRVWADELDRLPEYSTSVPTRVAHGKAWKTAGRCGRWWIRMFWKAHGQVYTLTFAVVLLQGPRRPHERSRFPMIDRWLDLEVAL